MVADTCILDRRASRARHARARATAAMPDADESRDDTLPVVCVFGSVNVDHAFRCATALPRAGETVGNATYERAPGGKGANQACAAARTASDIVRDRVGAPSDDPVARRGVVFASTGRRRWSAEASMMRSGRRRRRRRRVRASTRTRIDRRRRPSSSTRGDARARPSTSRRDDDDERERERKRLNPSLNPSLHPLFILSP